MTFCTRGLLSGCLSSLSSPCRFIATHTNMLRRQHTMHITLVRANHIPTQYLERRGRAELKESALAKGIYASVRDRLGCAHTQTHTQHTYIHTLTHSHTLTNKYNQNHTHAYTRVWLHTLVHAYIHTHTLTHAYTSTRGSLPKLYDVLHHKASDPHQQ